MNSIKFKNNSPFKYYTLLSFGCVGLLISNISLSIFFKRMIDDINFAPYLLLLLTSTIYMIIFLIFYFLRNIVNFGYYKIKKEIAKRQNKFFSSGTITEYDSTNELIEYGYVSHSKLFILAIMDSLKSLFLFILQIKRLLHYNLF